MKHVLVTGGAGFIGHHLSQRLIDKGYAVRILDNLCYGKKNWVPQKADFVEGDIRDLAICQQAMQGIDGVFHCAAMSRAAPSLTDIELCTEVNIVGTQNLLMAARDAKVKKIIYSGSSTYYGNQKTPHQEYITPGDFLNFYALSKYTGEHYCLLFDKMFDLPCVVLRYFNVYGPGQPRSGAYALVMGVFLEQKALNKTLIIHGAGNQRRDFIHVNDVVTANIMAYESAVRHEIFNVGSGKNISIKALASMISDQHKHEARRLGDADETLADISRMQKILGWHPSVDLQQGLTEMLHSISINEES